MFFEINYMDIRCLVHFFCSLHFNNFRWCEWIFLIFLYIFRSTLAFNTIKFLVSNIRLPAINCGMFLVPGIRNFEADIKMTFSSSMEAECIIWYTETKSPTKVNRMFKEKYGKNMVALHDGSTKAWHTRFKGTRSISAPLVRERTVNQELFIQSYEENP